MHSEQKPIYLCRNSKEAFKLSQHFNSKEKVMALHDFINNLFKKHPNINMPFRFFNAWRLIFKKYCNDKSIITFNGLIKIAIEHITSKDISIDCPIHFVNFDFRTPIEESFINACQTQIDVTFFVDTKIKPSIESRIFLNEEHECMQVVEWCRNQIEQNKKILIVTPQLDQIIDRLTSLLDKTFHPESFTPSLSQEKRIYQFSLNTPLFHLSMIYLNIKLIEFGARGFFNIKDLKNILCHNGWSNDQELFLRYRLIHQLERKRRGNVSIHELIEILETTEGLVHLTPSLMKHLDQIQVSHHEWREKRAPSAWIKTFDAYLKNIQSSLLNPRDGYEEGVYEAWKKITETVSSLDRLTDEISIQDMLETLQYYLKKTTHQHQHEGIFKIDILGFHEITYETYDATWIMNLNEHNWPTAKKMGEEDIFPSPILYPFISSKPHEDINFNYKKDTFNHNVIEYIEDNTSIKIDVAQTAKSGIKLLEAQSICPAWAFYEFRLGAKRLEDEDEENLTTRLRGNLFHKTLEQFWMEYKSSFLVSALSKDELSKKIQDIAHKNISAEKKKYPRILPEFFNIEEIRLINYLENWIQFELKRGDFEVKETEKNIPIHLGCLNFNIKIDRIDEVNQNKIVIDYKSGATKTLNEWFLNAYGELQMPFYALFASDKPIDAIAIGVINSSKPQWVGIGRDMELLKGIKDASCSAQYQSWDDLLAFWRYRINDAAKSYELGDAAVRFAREKDMTYCHVKPILRLPERTLQFEKTKQ